MSDGEKTTRVYANDAGEFARIEIFDDGARLVYGRRGRVPTFLGRDLVEIWFSDALAADAYVRFRGFDLHREE